MLKKLSQKIVVNKKISRPKSAYTLVELSIVILILAVLMTGGLTITIGSFNKAKKISTQNKINEIYKSLGKFLLENKRLPCPASLELTKNDNSYGVEYGNGSGCGTGAVGSGVYVNPTNPNIFYGMIPAKTLNLPLSMGEDDFGSKISYVIDQRFTTVFQEVISSTTNSGFGTTEPYTSIITVKEKPSATSRDITQDAILVIISHGLNAFGAFNANARTRNPRSSDPDEKDNDYFSGFSTYFVNGVEVYDASGTACTAIACTIPSTANVDQTSVGYANTPTSLTCKTGYSSSPAPTYTCTASGTASVTGSCTAITCTIPVAEGASVNYTASFDKNFIYNSQNSEIFDDVVLFKTRNQIVQDFDAHRLVACINAGVEFGSKSAYYEQYLYGTSCGFDYKKIPEKYCDKFGKWFEINKCGSW